MTQAKYLKDVRKQYEDYPYPERKPEDEKHRLLETELTNFAAINSYCYQGKQDFQDYRVLVAGCGTGDAVIHSAEVLKNKNAEIVALDMTETSLNIAKERAAIRGLENITWIHDSLLEVPNLNLGKFDYINCCGVLHHLEDPDAGLMALKSVLKEDGCMGLMLYAQYGRTAIYQMQEMMRMINNDEENPQTKVDNTKLVLKTLPETNWFKHSEDYFADIKKYGDIGIYDLLLHSQDRAYSVPEVYDYVEKAGLNFVTFANRFSKKLLKPKNIIQDPELLAKVEQLEIRQQQAVAEIMIGILSKHTFYLSMQKDTMAKVNDLTNIPFLFIRKELAHLKIAKAIESLESDAAITLDDDYTKLSFKPTKHSKYIFKYLDAKHSLQEIFDKVNEELDEKLSQEQFSIEFQEIYDCFEEADAMFLRSA